jgi:hypothetical protein
MPDQLDGTRKNNPGFYFFNAAWQLAMIVSGGPPRPRTRPQPERSSETAAPPRVTAKLLAPAAVNRVCGVPGSKSAPLIFSPPVSEDNGVLVDIIIEADPEAL